MRSRALQWGVLGTIAWAAAAPSPSIRAEDVLNHLERTVAWYRRVNSIEQSASTSTDVLLSEGSRQASLKALQLAFDFAHAEAALIGAASGKNSPNAGSGNLAQAASKATDRVTSLQSRIAEMDAAIPRASARDRATLTAQRNELQAELDLAREIQSTIQNLVSFTGSIGSSGSGGLAGRIDELELSVPEARHDKQHPAPPPAASKTSTNVFHAESAGIVGLATELFSIHSSRAQVSDLAKETADLQTAIDHLQLPLIDQARAAIRRSDEIASAGQTQDAAQLADAEKELTGMVASFKQLSTAIVPLGEQGIAVGTAYSDLEEEIAALDRQSRDAGRYLLLRAGGLAVGIFIVLAIAELWRRAIFRYVQDARRRRQFLVMRRILMTVGLVFAVVLSFVTEFGSLATYAGFVTAGVAVALQNPILSVVAYFFLIGRYGIRVGDRVTISGVTGDVIEIGLVRIYLMEVIGIGSDAHSTGRIVVFSNAVVFQPAALFKQMPGINYVWHSVTLTLAADSDFQTAETRLSAAVESVYAKYRNEIERQYASLQQSVDVHLSAPRPESRLQYTDAGLQFIVRYPAELQRASETDDQIVKALYDEVAKTPALKFAPSGRPRLQQAA